MNVWRLGRGVAALLVALVVGLGTLVAPFGTGATQALAGHDQGLNGGWAIDDSGHTSFTHSLSGSLGTMRQAGAGWVRVVFRLGGCYPTWTAIGCDGRTALQAYDQVVAAIRSQNLQILAILTAESWPGSQADWTASNAETAGGSGDNAYVAAFAQQAAAVLAQHFAGQVDDWEVWNEPNAWTTSDGQGHFSGSSYLYPSNYAWLLQRSYQAIKAAQPGAHVLFGGLFAHESFGAQVALLVDGRPQRVIKRGDMPGARRPPPRGRALSAQSAAATCTDHTPPGSDSGASYLCATYAVGLGYANWTPGAYPFDDVGQHLYLALGTSVSSGTLQTYLQDLRQAYLVYEGAATTKRTQVTEVGWPTDQVSQQVQADNLRVAFQTLQATSYVARTYWFSTQDAPEAGLYYGLVDTNGAPKPSFAAYQQYAAFGTPPPTATPTPTPTPWPTPTPVPIQPPVGAAAIQVLLHAERIADTRIWGGAIQSGTNRCFAVAGQGGIPSDAAGVVLNVAAVGQATSGWLTVYPNGQALPATSTLNFNPAAYALANSAIMRIGSNGQVCVGVGTPNGAPGNAQVILDATGYLTSSSLAAMPLLPAPQRLVDTRLLGGALPSGSTRCFQVAGQQGIPADAAALVLNVTAVGYVAPGWLTAYPAGQPMPSTSTLNFDPAEYAIANGAIVRLGSGGQVCLNVGTVNGAPGGAHVIIDASGYVTTSGLAQLPLLPAPQRLADTRLGGGSIPSGATRCFPAAGLAGIPASATSVMLTVTAVGDTTPGWLTVYPQGQPLPATSTLDFDPSAYAIANGAVLPLGSGGQVCVAVGTVNGASGGAHVVLDVTGYLLP